MSRLRVLMATRDQELMITDNTLGKSGSVCLRENGKVNSSCLSFM